MPPRPRVVRDLVAFAVPFFFVVVGLPAAFLDLLITPSVRVTPPPDEEPRARQRFKFGAGGATLDGSHEAHIAPRPFNRLKATGSQPSALSNQPSASGARCGGAAALAVSGQSGPGLRPDLE